MAGAESKMVRRLKDTTDPEIQAWMLREGFRNNIMDEYLACICARAGKLHLALNDQFVDAMLLDAAAEMIRALITGGPAEDIDDYESSVSGYKSNRISWLELSSNSDWESNASNTSKMGTFSRLVMLKICRIW